MNGSCQRTQSVWKRGLKLPHGGGDPAPLVPASPLVSSGYCDTVIVGSGIAGLSAAYELALAGRRVVVVDRGPIAGGVTSRTTAHLSPVCDDGFGALIRMRGEATARLFHQSQSAAVDRIEAIVRNEGIECGFRRLDGYLFPPFDLSAEQAERRIDEEYEAAARLGAEVERVRGLPLHGLDNAPALRFSSQATFHPLAYIMALADAIVEAGGKLFAHSPVIDVVETDGGVRLSFEQGAEMVASRAIFATNSPINNIVAVHSKMAPYRTYAMAFGLPRGALADGLFWDFADPYHYVRLHPAPDGMDWLIVGGEDHRSGEAEHGPARFEALEAWIRRLVPKLGREVSRWSGQVLETMDYCGYIGRSPGSDCIYIATGDSGQGMTHGVLAGLLLKQLVEGQRTPWAEVYDPARKTVSGALNYVRENATTVESFAEYLTPGQLESTDQLGPGQGAILRNGLKKIAACRDDDGVLHFLSASCTHLGCIVHWNSTERCWDCPCHGSQFAPDGSVLNGPAVRPLSQVGADTAK